MNTYAGITLFVDIFYDKAYLDNRFSLKADVSQITELVTTGCSTAKYTNSVELPTGYYKKTDIDSVLLYYSTGSYVGYNFYTKPETDTLLADKVTNIYDSGLPGMLDIGTSGYTNSRIRCNAELNGYTGYAGLRAYSSYDMHLDLSTARTDGGWMYFKINNGDYIQVSGCDDKVNMYTDTAISGNSDVCGIMNTTRINLKNDDQNSFPLAITNTGANWFHGEYVATANKVGCLFRYKTSGSSTYWWSGVWGANTNDFNTCFKYKGLSIKSNGSAATSGNLDVGVGAASSLVKAHVNHEGSTGHIQIEAKIQTSIIFKL